jgi:hypothetical protein
VAHAADAARRDQVVRVADRREPAVVERRGVDHAGRVGGGPHGVGLVGGAAQRLLAQHVLAGPGGRDDRRGVLVVRTDVVEQVHGGVVDRRLPVGGGAGEPEARRGGGGAVAVAADQDLEARRRDVPGSTRPRRAPEDAQGVRVGAAHEGRAQHRDADRFGPGAHAPEPTRVRSAA